MKSTVNSATRKLGRRIFGISPSFIASLSRQLALATLAAVGLGEAQAGNLFWDPNNDGVTFGGIGNWDTTSSFWSATPADGLAANNVPWVNANNDTAIFDVIPGTVTISGGTGITAGGLTFNTLGYTIAGATAADVLTLGGATPTITVTNASDFATITANIAGAAGLTKAGPGTLNLAGANTFTGNVTINAGTLVAFADNSLGAAANTVNINGGVLSAAGTFSSARTVNLGATGGTLDVSTGFTLTLTTALPANANALTKTGPGTLLLNPAAASARTGPTAVSNGILNLGNVGAAGIGDITVTNNATLLDTHNVTNQNFPANVFLNGGTFSLNPAGNIQLNFTGGKVIDIGVGGGTVNVAPGALATSKILLAAGQLQGAGLLTKTGPGVMQLSGANPLFTGTVTINQGTVEFQSVDALGTLATTVTVNNGGDFVTSAGVINRNNVTLNTGGTISANIANGTFAGNITAAGNATIALRQFQTVANAISFNVSGPISGSGNLTVTAPAAATLTLSSDRTAHTGQIIPGTNATVAYTNPLAYHTPVNLAGGVSKTVFVNSAVATNGVQGLNATYYNTGFNPNVSTTVPVQFATDNIYVTPRAFSRIDANVNIPVVTTGTGEFPIVPVPGFAYGTTVGGQNDAIMWKGLLTITNPGFYQFLSATDDQDILYIDGVPIGTHAGNTGGNITNLGTPLNLTAGKHSIVYKMTNGGTGGYAVLQYFGGFGTDAETQMTIPSAVLSTGSLAALDLGPITTTAAGGGIDFAGPATSTSITLGGGTFTLTSPTIDNFTAPGIALTGNVTLAPTSAGLIVTAPITEDATPRTLTFAGPYFAEFQAVNTYTGGTTVTGGQLRLNVAGGNAFKGNLTLNAPNANGPVVNVSLSRPNQIEDTATLTMTNGILDLGPNSELISALIMNGGTILGTAGVLTVTNAPTLAGGVIAAQLAGNWNLVKTGTGTATLSGNNTFQGVTNVNAGVLNAFSTNALGAGGAGNGTVVASGASLRLGGANVASEDVTISGTGLAGDASEGALRHLGGVSQIHNLTTGAAATVRVDSGEVIISGALDVSGGALTKTGNGVLTFATPQSVIPTVTHTGGAIGFSGTQNFGAVSVPAGLAYQFDTNPLTGGGNVSVAVPATGTLIANFPVDQSFLGIIAAGSTGTLALTGTNPNNLDFSTVPAVTIGSKTGATITGTLTPNAAGYQLGGGGGKLTVQSVLAGNVPLNITGEVQLNGQNTFTGTATIKAGGKLVYVNDQALGTATNSLVLDGGTLQMINASDITGGTGTWATLGYPANGGGRILTVGPNGGTIDIPARQAQGNFGAIVTNNGLIGSGALTKTGLGFLEILTSNSYSGTLTLAANGNRVDLRSTGALPNITGLVIESRAELDVDNNSTLGSTRLYASVDNRNRFNDAAAITLNGGILRFVGRNVAFAAGTPATSQENFGTVTAGFGQSLINSTRTGGGGSDMVINNLIRTYGNGTINFTTDGNTLGITGDNPRIFINSLNGGAAPAFNSFIGGWATINQSDFAAYGNNATIGGAANTVSGIVNYGTVSGTGSAPAYAALTAAATPGTGNFSSGVVGNAAASLALGNAGAGQNFVVGALRFGSGATAEVISFTDTSGTPDTLFVESGGIITDNGAGAKSIGVNTSAFTRGQLTAGAVGASTPQELFFHNNTAAALTVVSTIIDNPSNVAATVRVVKAQDGTVVLDSGADSYSGGTLVLRGTLTANNTGSLGKGAVIVKNSTLNVANTNATSGTVGIASTDPVYTTFDQSTIVLTGSGTTVSYTGSADRFSIASGSAVYANSGSANFGFNSLTRIAAPNAFTGGGQIYLAPGAIVKHNVTNAANQGTGILTIKNLGTAADLFFGPVTAANTASFNQTITVGTGTPWAGLSSDRSNLTWNGGTIFANSDFIIQGLVNNGAQSSFTIGENNTSGSTATKSGGVQIVNNTNGPINARLVGAVIINEDEPITLPSNLTFVVTPGAIFQPNTSADLGYGTSKASVLVQAGGILDPGNYTPIGTGGNQQFNADGTLNGFQNLPYPLVSPLNGQVTVEAGGKFIINDASGIGSAPVGSYTVKTNGVLDIGNANAFFGRGTYSLNPVGTPDTTGLAVPGQFVYEPGAIVHLNADNVYKISQFTSPDSTFVVFNANRTYTNNNNPFIIPVAGTPTIAPEDFRLANGGMVTDDSNDRQLNEGRGRMLLDNGAVLASTTGTYFSIQEGWNATAGANITIGAAKYVDGMSKLGAVQFNGPNSNVAGAGVTFTVTDGAQMSFGGANVFPDNANIVLTAAVQAFPGTGGLVTQPATGSTLLLNTGSFMEYTGVVTGNGAIIANNTGMALAMNTTTDATTSVVFKNTNAQQPSLMKAGPATLTLTGLSDSQGSLVAQQGTLVVAGGTGDWNDVRPQKGATIVVDNTVNATNNRLGILPFIIGQGGTFQLKGNATTPTTEYVSSIATGAGNFLNQAQNGMISTLKITTGAATTNLASQVLENYQSAGQRTTTYVVNTPAAGNVPITYGTGSGVVIPNAGNLKTGLLEVFTPNFGVNGAFNFGPGIVFGSAGTSVAAARGDYLGDANGDGVPDAFMTEDGVNYAIGNVVGTAVITGLPSTSGLTPGMPVTGTNIPVNTRILTVDSATQVTLTNVTATAATTLNVTIGGMRNLTASEYTSFLRDNQTVGSNVKLSGVTNVTGDSRIQTLTMLPGSTLNINGTLPLNGTSSRVLINSSGIMVPAGAGAATINGSSSGNTLAYLQAAGGTGFYFHTLGDLNLNANIFSDTGVTKTGNGTLTVGPGVFTGFRASVQIDGGLVKLGAGNGFSNIRSQNGSTSNNNVYLNAGTFDLGGNNEMINLLNSANELPGNGGILTSVAPATVTNVGGGRFSGVIDGAISIDKTGNNTLLLTNAQTYTGTTVIRAGTLQLRDSGTLSSSAGQLTIRNATVQIDDSYLANVPNRIAPTIPVVMNSGTLNITGAAGQVATQTINNLTLQSGFNNFTSNAGGSGANELNIGNLIRAAGPNGSGATLNIQQNYGFVGTAGNTTTAIRDFITNVNGTPLALNNGIIGGWAIVNGNDFATYRTATGVGAYGNTADGYPAYESTNATTALATQNVNDGTARTIGVNSTINSWRIAPNAAVIQTIGTAATLTIGSGGLLTNNNNTVTFTSGGAGASLTSGTGELDVFVNQNTTIIGVPIIGNIDLVKGGAGALTLSAVNTYTGTTYINGGSANLSLTGADGAANIVIPGKLVIDASTVTETVASQLSATTGDIVLVGGGRYNLMNAASITETIRSLTFLDGSSGTATTNGLDRTALQLGSTINLSGANAITATNTSPSTGVPFIGGFAGNVGFTNPAGATLNITSPTSVNGVLAVGLRIGARIGVVPNVAGGGLIKTGTGLLTIDPDQTPTFTTSGSTVVGSPVIAGIGSTVGMVPGMQIAGTNIPAGSYIISVDSPTQVTINTLPTVAGAIGTITAQPVNFTGVGSTLTDVLNIQSGTVRADRHGSLGSPFANTTVQNGAVLLGANTGAQVISGSVTMKDGSTMGATINAFTLGAATDVAANQAILNVPSGNVTIATYDYYVPSSNSGNITINSKLTGSGNINLYGQQITQGNGGGGFIQLSNPFGTGVGAGQTDYSGTISVGTNAILINQIALIPKNVATIPRATGSALGTGTINLNGGRLRVRDDATSGTSAVSNAAVTYGNPITLSANSFLDVGRVNTADTNSNNIIDFGALTVTAGTKVLNVDSNTGTGAGAGLGNYITRFSSLTGSGNFVKAGLGRLQFNDIPASFTGSLTIAGPQTLVVAATFNTTTQANLILPNTATVPAFNLGGFYITEAGKTLNVAGAFTVNSNAGDIATNKSNVPGTLAVTNTTNLSVGNFINNGVVGATGGTATINSVSGFSGTGHYIGFGNQLTLNGPIGAIKVAGASNTSVSTTANSYDLTGVRIESGVLKLTPANNAGTSTGNALVLGSPASTASATTAAIAAVSGALAFDGGPSGTFTHNGSITSSGTVRAAGGTVTINGSINGTDLGYTPGLLEGYTTVPGGALDASNARTPNPGNFGIRMEPRMLQTNAVTQNAITGHTDNDTWVYTGYVKDDDGVFSFAENIDDRAAVWIDGALVLNAANGGTSRVVSTAYKDGQAGTGALTVGSNLGTPSQNFGPGISLPGFGDGWHLIEIRMNNGAGGSGPINGNGFAVNYGFGYKNGIAALDGGDMIKPIDNGTGNLFVTPVGGTTNIQVDAGATMNVPAFTKTGSVTLAGGTSSTPAFFNLTGASSTAANLEVTGTSVPQGNVDVANNLTLTTGTLNVVAGATLNINPTHAGTVVVTGNNFINGGGVVDVLNGTLNITSTSVGSGGGGMRVETGAKLIVDGSLLGSVDVSLAATLKGAGTFNGPTTLGFTATLDPDRTATAMMTFNNSSLLLGSDVVYDFGLRPSGLSDTVAFTGFLSSLTITDTWTLKLTNAGLLDPTGQTLILFDGDPLGAPLNAGLIGTPTIDRSSGFYVGGTISFDAANNDIILTGLVPEPGSAALLLGGMACLAGFRRRRQS